MTRFSRRASLRGKGLGFLEGLLQGAKVLGASAASPSNDRLHKTFKGLQGSVHSGVVRRLKEIQGEQSRFKLKIQIQEMSPYISGDPAHGPSSVRSRKAKADIRSKWSVR